MKTKLLTLAAIAAGVLAIGSANAADDPVWQAEATCEGGSLQTGENGHVYCLSKNSMNWWSAYTWCQAQGRHLVTMYEVCATWDGGGSNCNLSTFSSNPDMWSATALDSNQAFVFDQTRVVRTGRSETRKALCY